MQKCTGGNEGHLKNVTFKYSRIQLILHWDMNVSI